MATDPEKTNVPPSKTNGGNTPDADDVPTTSGGAVLPNGQGVDPSIREAATNAMKTVRDYAASKRA